MKQLTLVTWNAEGMFVAGTKTTRALPHDALHALKELDVDFVVIPEFGRKGLLDDSVRNAINSLGYQIVEVPYEDDSTGSADIELAVLSRLPISSTIIHHLGGARNCVELRMKFHDNIIRVFGVHLDDKTEQSRLAQVRDLSEIISVDTKVPTLVMGDLNAMRYGSRFAMLSRSKLARNVSRRMRHTQMKSILTRLHDMALGTTIAYLEESTRLHDLDPGHHHTISAKQAGLEWIPAVRLAKIDWVFGTKQFHVTSYKVLSDVGSDHRPVKVTVAL